MPENIVLPITPRFKTGNYGYNSTHGQSKTRIYRVWRAMRTRCENKNCWNYERYGGRGVRVCKRWKKFANFIADMGDRPTSTHQIDRIDNEGDYCPENCRWVTGSENCRNRRSNRILNFRGKSLCVTDWAERIGMSAGTLIRRLYRGWSIERMLTTPVAKSDA
jgi:hypothetical protein